MTTEEIVATVAREFRCFGGGQGKDSGNPIAVATAEKPPFFALGVDVRSVVERVVALGKQRGRRRAA